MSSTHLLLQNVSLQPRISTTTTYARPSRSIQVSAVLSGRRQSLILFTASTVLTAIELSSAGSAKAKDIGLFGIRKKLEKVEEKAEAILKEGAENAEAILKEGAENAEKGLEAAERGVENAGKELESATSFSLGGGVGGLIQAGVVVGAEAVGVLVATSIVSGILGPES
ncbi:hypothetical protein MKW94_026531 [Papaver nudicaule]|uniref:Uncharacterized protein n=1 Tax=Papaver nudicaule TaxID=74823 RepID=A0AA41SB78_PAPNU|nr:hypothetical protein [Papaver nudicaule]